MILDYILRHKAVDKIHNFFNVEISTNFLSLCGGATSLPSASFEKTSKNYNLFNILFELDILNNLIF